MRFWPDRSSCRLDAGVACCTDAAFCDAVLAKAPTRYAKPAPAPTRQTITKVATTLIRVMSGAAPALVEKDDARGGLTASIEVACDTLRQRGETAHMSVHECTAT